MRFVERRTYITTLKYTPMSQLTSSMFIDYNQFLLGIITKTYLGTLKI